MTPLRLLLSLAAALASASSARAAVVSYGGTLSDEGRPGQGLYTLRATLHDASLGGRAVGVPHVLPALEVRDGRFLAEFDFGMDDAMLDALFLQVEIAGADGAFETLGPRQALAKGAAACWATSGNSGTVAGSDFVGTLDNQPLVAKVNGAEALRIEPSATSPNFIAGHADNFALSGVFGATVSGGGGVATANRVVDHFGTVGGGRDNVAGSIVLQGNSLDDASDATVSGGSGNVASGNFATVGGGVANRATATYAVIAGGGQNEAVGIGAMIAGGYGNYVGGAYSFAAGRNARVRDDDILSFVWSDFSSDTPYSTTGPRQFLVGAHGGVAFNGTPPRESREVTIWGNGQIDGNVDLHLRPSNSSHGFSLMVEALGQQSFVLQTGDGIAMTERLRVSKTGDLAITGNATKPGGGSWAAPSDARLKKNIVPLHGALARVLALRGVRFEYAQPDPARRPPGVHDGFVAQDVRKVFPSWVASDGDGYLTVAPQGFEALAVEALRELAEENAQLHARLERLEARLQGVR